MRIYQILFLLLISPVCSLAQERQADSQKPTFRVVCFGNWAGEELFVEQKKRGEESKIVKLELYDMGYSPALTFKPGKKVAILRKTSDPEKPYEIAHQIAISEKVHSPLILFVPLSEEKVRFKVFDLDPKVFPYGSCQVMNFSKKDFMLALNKDVRKITPNKVHSYPAIRQLKLRTWFRIADAKSKDLVFSSMLTRRQQKRSIVFIVGLENDKVIVKTLEDYYQG